MRKNFFTICTATFIASTAHARTLHYGEWSMPLTDTQKTFPALHIQISPDEMAYGAMYDVNTIPAANDTIRIKYEGTEYWVAPWCAWRQYMPTGTRDCIDIPVNALNRFLTLDEANKYIIPTDIQQWDLISTCNIENKDTKCTTDTTSRNIQECGCTTGTLQPGTYLFYEYYDSGYTGLYNKAKSQIAVFDHAVGYRQQHTPGVFENLIDTEHETYVTYTLKTPYYKEIQEDANVTNMPRTHSIYIYKLK